MHLFIEEKGFSLCGHCKQPKMPHAVCPNCGYHKGVEVVNVLAKLEKKDRKAREKEIAQAQKEEKQHKPVTMEELSKQKF